MTKYFIGVVSKDHVIQGIKEGIAQIGHGKRSGLARMHKGDYLIYYSPKVSINSTEKLQEFTAIGEVIDDTIYQVEILADFKPYRRKVSYFKLKDAPIIPLIDKLSFIQNKKQWGYVFRFGLVEIQKEDFDLIYTAMLPSV